MPLIAAPRSVYPALRHLVPSPRDAGHMAFVYGILEGEMPGTMLVDDLERPRSAVACNDSGFWFAIGEPRRDLVADSIGLLRSLLARYTTQLFPTTVAWAEALDPLFAERHTRNEYHFTVLPSDDPPMLPAGFELTKLTPDIARKFKGAVDPWVVEVWGGPASFGRRVFGWAVMRGPDLASFCTFCGLGGGEAEIEIGTAEPFRQMGLAYAAGHAFVRTALERGYSPAWTCSTGNTGSERLAEKLGFVEFRKVRGYPLER